jgi:alginate O-acetyltransferase complex protein AlgI
MLFNSYHFIFVFLPLTVIGFFIVARLGPLVGAGWLALASLVFYGAWNIRFIPLIVGSMSFNFVAGRAIAHAVARDATGWLGRLLLAGAITSNLALLGYFKYAGFFITTMTTVTGQSFFVPHIVLPLGISFFTFTQIAYLVDTWKRKANERNPIYYALFVTYFPHLIAGPILHHGEMIPQFRVPEVYRLDSDRFTTGITTFAIGLAKKVVLADGIAHFVAPIFNAAEQGARLTFPEAWGGALAYTFQLYFDFSGYCDMAIGLSWLIGIALPLNFASPYKSANIIDFWRRWHMTLSRFLRDYLYIPLGGNRRGPTRRYINLLLTMAIGGLWHGAGWTFVAWGTLHGFYLMVNHAWLVLRRRLNFALPHPVGFGIAWFVTFVAVVMGWVLFRADSMFGASRILAGMVGLHGMSGGPLATAKMWAWCAIAGAIALLMPNAQEIMRDYYSGIARTATVQASALPLVFRRAMPWAVVTAIILAAGMINLPKPTSFLYFNF